MKKTLRARRTPKVTRTDNPTAARGRKRRAATVPPYPLVFEKWGTIAPPATWSQTGFPSVCVWGTELDAIEGRDADEKVCRMRIEVLEIVE